MTPVIDQLQYPSKRMLVALSMEFVMQREVSIIIVFSNV